MHSLHDVLTHYPDEDALDASTAPGSAADDIESGKVGDADSSDRVLNPEGTMPGTDDFDDCFANDDVAEGDSDGDVSQVASPRGFLRGISWTRVAVFGVIPLLAMLLAVAAGWLRWQQSSMQDAGPAGAQAVNTASQGAVAILSYSPGSVDRDLHAAQDRLTGGFRDAYTQLTTDVVIPGAKQKQISAIASVPAAGLVSATENHAVVVLCVNQTTIIGTDAPTSTASSVRVTLDKLGDRWLISGFDPI